MKGNWLQRNYLVIVMFLLVLGVTVALFIFRNEITKLGNYGYLGTFLLSLATNATIILPMPNILMILPLGATFNPLYIGLAAGLGGAVGEMTAYIAGYSGSGLWHENQNYLKAKGWLKKWGMLIVFVFAASPMPLDIIGRHRVLILFIYLINIFFWQSRLITMFLGNISTSQISASFANE